MVAPDKIWPRLFTAETPFWIEVRMSESSGTAISSPTAQTGSEYAQAARTRSMHCSV
jgi:hypothetical protein